MSVVILADNWTINWTEQLTESVLEAQSQQQDCENESRKTLQNNGLDKAQQAESIRAHLQYER